jgi:hypothetical protein
MRLMVMVMLYYYDGFYDGAVCYDGDVYDYEDYFDDNYAAYERGYYYDLLL